ncbi:Concanavalin A-like lectin/glucanases superfamily protein [anaerobic digester metagenome]
MKHTGITLIFLLLLSVTATAQVPTVGLVGYWPFDGNANDMSGCTGNGTVYGAVLDSGRFNDVAGAYWFDGINDRISCADTFHLTTRATICVWTKFSDITRTMVFMCKYNAGMDEGLMLGKINDGHVFCAGRNGNNQYLTTGYSKGSLSDDDWHFLVGVCDSNKWEIWVDGNLDNTATYNLYNYSIHSTSPVTFGYEPVGSAYYYEGYLDDARFYRRALDGTEILALYYEGTTGLQSHCPGICRVYPNPATERIVFTDMKPESVRIFDQQGKLVLAFDETCSGYQSFDISSLTNGMYLIEACADGKVYHQKLLKE